MKAGRGLDSQQTSHMKDPDVWAEQGHLSSRHHPSSSARMMACRWLDSQQVPHIEDAHARTEYGHYSSRHHFPGGQEALVHDACQKERHCQGHCSRWLAELALQRGCKNEDGFVERPENAPGQ